ncbi:guanine nucleotide-binding protein-like 3 [Huso huso]|uniref:Guanine nucleotide-binding protein-like 3 n=1 Tax=Huso huso TaxID=61971 RepID=A0ABR0Z788_HUSHU
MKRPKLKKASKRLTCSKRYKIQKKVREHNKKLRKEAKKQKVRKVKKDPGIPNAAPFKEEILREAEHRKLQLEELKEKQKLTKQKERAKKRKLEAEKNDPVTKAKKAKKEQTVKKQLKSTSNKDKNSKTLFCSELKKVIEASDVILEVLDARDPLGCRCPQVEETILNLEGKKQLILVLNKIDLVPKDNVEKWLKYLQNEFPTVAFKASTQLQDKTVQQKKRRAASGAVDLTKGVTCLGSDFLLQLLGDYYRSRGTDDAIKVGVVGFPNVGKSSLINSMKKMRACHVGISRCTTRCMQLVHIDKSVKMLDSPGIIAGSLNSAVSLALRSASEMEELVNPLEAVNALLKHCNKQQVMLQYNIPNYRNSLEFLTLFAMKRGCLKKGGVPDTQKAAETLLNDWTGAKVSYHSKPPEQHKFPSHLSETAVAERLKEWGTEKLEQGNLNTIKNVKCPNMASSIMFHSTGPTDGVLDEGVVKEPDEGQDEDEEVETGSEEEDEEEEELELDEIKPKVKKVLPVDKASNGKSEEETTGAQSTLQSQVVPVSIDFSSSKKDDDAYDFNTDFN